MSESTMTKEQQLFAERLKRVDDAIALKSRTGSPASALLHLMSRECTVPVMRTSIMILTRPAMPPYSSTVTIP